MKMKTMITNQVKLLINLILSHVYQILWLSIHFVYRWQFDIRENLQKTYRQFIQRLLSCLPTHSYYGELLKLTKATEGFSKTPKHVAFSVVVENTNSLKVRRGNGKAVDNDNGKGSRRRGTRQQDDECGEEPIDLQLLAKVISWAWVARISVVSLYDYHGCLKKSYRELGCYIQEELIQNYWALKKYGRATEPPTIKFHNVPKLNGYSNGLGSNGLSSTSSPLHIVVFSYEDGKSDLIRATKQLYFNHLSATMKSQSPLLLSSTPSAPSSAPSVTTTTTTTEAVKNDGENESELGNHVPHQDQNKNNSPSPEQEQEQDDCVSSSNSNELEISTNFVEADKISLEKMPISTLNTGTGTSISTSTNTKSDSCNSINENIDIENIDERNIDALLNRNHTWPSHTGISTDPDLLFIMGNIKSTLGFLPWHIRLTEIHWLPKLQIVESKDFLQVLQKYSGCEQRFGS